MSADFYLVLGVSKDADPEQIKAAYRRLVKLYHPDASQGPVDRFHEVRQAYDVLSDPEARADHDRWLARRKSAPSAPAPERLRRPPLTRSRPPLQTAGPTYPSSLDQLFAEVDEILGGFVPGIYRRGRQTARGKNLYVELILSPDEARAGGLFPLKLPIERTCPDCLGHGFGGVLSCPRCRGRGLEVSYHSFDVSVPPGVAHGTSKRIALGSSGLRDTELVVRVLLERAG